MQGCSGQTTLVQQSAYFWFWLGWKAQIRLMLCMFMCTVSRVLLFNTRPALYMEIPERCTIKPNYLFISVVHDLLDIMVQISKLSSPFGFNGSSFFGRGAFCTEPCTL